MMYADPLEDEQLKTDQQQPKKTEAPTIAPIVPPAGATTNATTSGAQATTQAQQPTVAPAPQVQPPVNTAPIVQNAPTMTITPPAPTASASPQTMTTAQWDAYTPQAGKTEAEKAATLEANARLLNPNAGTDFSMYQAANKPIGDFDANGVARWTQDPAAVARMKAALPGASSAGQDAAALSKYNVGTGQTNYDQALTNGRSLLSSVQGAGGLFSDAIPKGLSGSADFMKGLTSTDDWIANYMKQSGFGQRPGGVDGTTSNTAQTLNPPTFAGGDLPRSTGSGPMGDTTTGARSAPSTSNITATTGGSSGTGTPAKTPEQQLQDLKDQFITPSRQTEANDVDPYSAVTTIDPNNDLRSTTITNTPDARSADYARMVDDSAKGLAGVDRTKLAEEMFNTFAKDTDPAYALAQRRATKQMAATGRLWSGKARTSYGDLEHTRLQELDSQKQKLMQQALSDSVGDQFNKTSALSGLEDKATATNERGLDALRGERQYQTGQENDAFTRAYAQYQAQQNAKNTAFNQNLSLLNAGEAGNPAGTLGAIADQMAPTLDANSIAQLARSFGSRSSGGAGGASGGANMLDPQSESLINQILSMGVPGVKTTGTAAQEPAGGLNMSSILSSLVDPRVMDVVNSLRNRAPAPTS